MKLISIIMGIYNCENTLREAVYSIFAQTYSNWDLIMCDDGSTDNTYEVAKELSEEDDRIILIKNKKNRGLNYTLNRCLQFAKGDYIARMDGDDLSIAERFEKEISFLEEHSEYGLVSSPMIFFDENGEWGRSYAIEEPTKADVLTGGPICHAPVMIRKECMDAVGGYTVDRRMLRVEDVNLWIKIYAKGYRCYNIQEPLYKMRNDKNAYKRRKYKYRINSVYVRLQGCRLLKAEPICYVKAFKPMLAGLIPGNIRKIIKKKMSEYN